MKRDYRQLRNREYDYDTDTYEREIYESDRFDSSFGYKYSHEHNQEEDEEYQQHNRRKRRSNHYQAANSDYTAYSDSYHKSNIYLDYPGPTERQISNSYQIPNRPRADSISGSSYNSYKNSRYNYSQYNSSNNSYKKYNMEDVEKDKIYTAGDDTPEIGEILEDTKIEGEAPGSTSEAKSHQQGSHTRFTEESRSLYVGHLPDAAMYYDLCKAAHDFGPLELVRLVPKKKCAFLNFLYLKNAKDMMEKYSDSALPHPEDSENQDRVLKILGKAVRLSWSETRPVPEDILEEVQTKKASRNLFIFYGNCVRHDPEDKMGDRYGRGHYGHPPVVTAAELAEKFRDFGNIENIVIKPKRNIAFINMTSISAAIAAFKASQAEDEGEGETNDTGLNGNEKRAQTGSASTPSGLLLRGARLVVKYSTEEKSKENYTHERNDPRNQPFSYNSHYNFSNNSHRQGSHSHSHSHSYRGERDRHHRYNDRFGSSRYDPEEPQLPRGWMQSIDEHSGCRYYYNTEQRITQWEHPVTGKPSPPVKPQGFDSSNYQNGHFGSSGGYGDSGGMNLGPSRAVILQNLPANVDYAMLCTLGRQFGMIESVRLHADKSMAFINYVDGASAGNLFDRAHSNPIIMEGHPLNVGWAKEVPIKGYLYEAIIHDGANRSIYLRDLPDDISEGEIREEFKKHSNGEIESVILRPQEKPFGFVNFIDIISAKKIVDIAKKNEGNFVINGKSVHVSYVNTRKLNHHVHQKSSGYGYGGHSQRYGSSSGSGFRQTFGGGSSQCRSVIISGFPRETTLTDIAKLGNQFGPIESLHLVHDKNHAFINFVEPQSATKFMTTAKAENGYEIRDEKVRVGYGKSVPIRHDVMNAIQSENASRSIYVGGVEGPEREVQAQLKDLIRNTCREEDIESIIVNEEKKYAFMNFTSIQTAKKVVNAFRETTVGGVPVKLSYAKPPKN